MESASNSVVCVRWNEIGVESEFYYTSGCVIKKTKFVLVLTSAYLLKVLIPQLTEERFQETINEVCGRIRISVKFTNQTIVKGYLLLGASIQYNLALLGFDITNRNLDAISTARFTENSLRQRDLVWSIHNCIVLKEDDDGDISVDFVLPFSFTSGNVSHPARSHSRLPSMGPYLEYWMPLFGSGSYGAPIFNTDNEVVALHSIDIQNIYFGVPTSIIKSFIKKTLMINEGDDLNEILTNVAL